MSKSHETHETHEIAKIVPGSIAWELEIAPGDFLLQINGKEIQDVLDYRFEVESEELLLEVQKGGNPSEGSGEIWELEIEKDAEEDLGIVFKEPLMSKKRECTNKCIFCFVEQQPKGLRPSLYVKDDDIRLSFLHGNYVTLTNLSVNEIERIAGYHLSPLRISVHASDLGVREKMMNNKNAKNLFNALEIFSEAEIKMHFQVVLCKGVNDGILEETIMALQNIKGAESLAVVPAGITRHREGLYPLQPFSGSEAGNILRIVKNYQEIYREKVGKSFVFAADEWYIMSGEALPNYEQYEDFPQLDNGVGMLRLFEQEFLDVLKNSKPKETRKITIGIITGQAAANHMQNLASAYEKQFSHTKIMIHPIRNDFFGENITVSGLLTGTDIIAQLKGKITADMLFIPENAFRVNTEEMLDGTTLESLAAELNAPIKIGSTNGSIFKKQLESGL
ncbi:MAG: DUF512 domain-containing protein [Defluviitaleaceae bacterium]|nr:DUF512 domain-containing protein [Defluviitaleaceae bacterium]